MRKKKALVSWSSGKDSAWALQLTTQRDDVEVAGLLTTVTEAYDRVSMHGVRRELLHAQATQLDLPLVEVSIPSKCTNETYDERMLSALRQARECGVELIIAGDILLEDVRAYRTAMFAKAGLASHYPLWGRDTRRLALEMIDGPVRATLTCVDPQKVPPELAGRRFDRGLLAELPDGVDWCGENGEFHTFVHDIPAFTTPLACEVGERVVRDGFIFADLLPVPSEPRRDV